MSEAMRRLVCWLYFQVVVVLYFIPHLDGIQRCGWVGMGLVFHGPPLVFFPIDFGNVAKTSKTSRSTQSFLQCGLRFALLLRHPNQKKKTRKPTPKKNKPMEVHDWLRDSVFCSFLVVLGFFCFSCFFFWFGRQSRRAKCKQHWRNWLCLMILPMKNMYIYIHIHYMVLHPLSVRGLELW